MEKHQGYAYSHMFSFNWNAMKGYHYLMHIGHALSALAQYSEHLSAVVAAQGIQNFIAYIRENLTAPWFTPENLGKRLKLKPQLRLA